MSCLVRSSYLPEARHGLLAALLPLIASPVLQGIDGPGGGILHPLVLHHHPLSAQHLKETEVRVSSAEENPPPPAVKAEPAERQKRRGGCSSRLE